MNKTILGLAAAIAIATTATAAAQTRHDDWQSFSKDGRCWAATAPKDSTGSIPGRSAPYLSIQNHPDEGVRGSVSVVAGFDEAGVSEASIEVDGKKFDVLPFGGAAFVASGKPEAALISSMRRGKEMVATWTASDGSTATDRYSLIGFIAAKAEMDRRCR